MKHFTGEKVTQNHLHEKESHKTFYRRTCELKYFTNKKSFQKYLKKIAGEKDTQKFFQEFSLFQKKIVPQNNSQEKKIPLQISQNT